MNIVMHGGLGLLFWGFGSSTADRSRASFEILLLDVLGLGSLHQKHRDALFLAGLVLPDGFFWTFRRLPSRCCGSFFPSLLLLRFSVLLLRQRRFFCPSFVWTVPDYSLQPLCFGSCTSTSYTTSGIGAVVYTTD